LLAAVSLIVGFGLMTTPRVASAVPVVFSDGTFLDGEWTTTVLPSGLGGSGSAGQAATGGNPGAFREISITLVMPTSTTGARVDVVSIKPSAVYDPGTQAAIASIDYSEDAILLSGGGNGHALTLALEQAGVIYAGIPRLVSPDSAWTAKSLPGLVAADFVAISGGVGTPDFSASGAPIAFGFWRAFSSPPGSNGGTRVGGIDNWMVAVQPVPEPGSALLVGLGLGLISACRRAGVA
jgi:hypothetical protein